MKITLTHPPMDDPTLPYHSNAYLKGHLVHNGFNDVSLRDINVEFMNYCLEPATVEALYSAGQRRLADLHGRAHLAFAEQEEFYGLWAASRVAADDVRRAAEELRSAATFLDFRRYLSNVNKLIRYFGYLGALSYPSEIVNFKHMTRARYSIYNLGDLFNEELSDAICAPFIRFFRERLASDERLAASDCFGVSIVYDHQLFHALAFARLLKQTWPHKTVVLGGTSISQLYKHLRNKSELRRFFRYCDAIVVGEGETALCEIVARQGDLSGVRAIPNTIRYDRRHDRLYLPPVVHYENVAALGTPLYDHPWSAYLSPERGINYAPTRGCYWNRCTFCDYGLNSDRPTSPWRERPVDRVVADLAHARETQGVRYVYLAVDVMAPAYLERLSDALVDAQLDIRWSAELRMEKIFSASRCRKMASAGCVCVSFGMESGNQRVLDLIDKGTKVEYMSATMKNFADAGIAVQLMAFTDFPTETEQERAETFRFIKQNEAYWSTGGMGTFLLTGTSMIAKDPAKFGIELVATADADVTRALAYRVNKENDHKVLLTEDCDASFDESGGAFPPVLGRPWAGGTDTLHSMVYYNAYGRAFFLDHPLDGGPSSEPESDVELEDCTVFVPGSLAEARFDIGRIFDSRAAYKERIKQLLQAPSEPTLAKFVAWSASVPSLPSGGDAGTYWVTTGDRCVKLDRLVYRILKIAAERGLTLREMVADLGVDLKSRLMSYFRELEASQLVVFHAPGQPPDRRRRLVRVDERAVSRVVRVMPQGRIEVVAGA